MPTAAAHLAQADSGEGTGCPDLNEPKSSDKKPVATRNIAMRDLRWKHFLHGEHRNEILEAHKKEFDGLTGTILKELFPGDAKYKAAQRGTNCGLILEFKRVGVWKVRMVIQGFREDCVVLNGEDFKYNSDVAGLTAIRNIVFDLIRRNSDGTLEDVTLLSIDIAFAYLQSDLFPASCPPRYLKVKDPVTGTYRFFRQYGVLYGSRSSAVRWQQTLHPWLVSKGFEQGANEPCAFYHRERNIKVLSYVDDLLTRSSRANAEWFYKELSVRFTCKKPQWLSPDRPLDHLGMAIFQDSDGIYISMEDYIRTMLIKLEMENAVGSNVLN